MSKTLPNVLFDASYLGYAHRYQQRRDGIRRYTENIARALARRDDIRFTLCAPYRVGEAWGFRQATAWARGVPYAHSAARVSLDTPIAPLDRFVEGTLDDRRLQLRLLRRIAAKTAEAGRALQRRIDLSGISRPFVYHSPWQPIPSQFSSDGTLTFLTVYDLLPILLPHFFTKDMRDYFDKVLRSVGPRTRVLCISESTKADLCALRGFPAEHVFVTKLAAGDEFHPCSDPEQIRTIRRRYGIPTGPYFLSLSTLEPRKNCEAVIRAFAALVREEQLEEVHLVLVGAKGWSYEPIFRELEQLGSIKEHVIVTGFVPDEDLPALYSGATAFVYVPFYEGFGLPPLEAMKCGLPVITSNTSSLPEVVGSAGLLVPPDDARALVEAMRGFLLRGEIRNQFADAAQKRAATFTWERCADETVAAYRAALAEVE